MSTTCVASERAPVCGFVAQAGRPNRTLWDATAEVET